jgi:hypothetical protein
LPKPEPVKAEPPPSLKTEELMLLKTDSDVKARSLCILLVILSQSFFCTLHAGFEINRD